MNQKDKDKLVEKALDKYYDGLERRSHLKAIMLSLIKAGRQSMIKDVFAVLDTWEEGREDILMEKLEALKKKVREE